MNSQCEQNIDHSIVQKFPVNMLISWVIEWSKGGVPHQHTSMNLTHWASAIWDLSSHDKFWIIPNPGSQKRITLSVDYIRRVPVQAGTNNLMITEWGQCSSNRGMPCGVSILAMFGGQGISPPQIPARFLGPRRICFQPLPFVRQSGRACWLPDSW